LIFSPHYIKLILETKQKPDWYLSKPFVLVILILIFLLLGKINLSFNINISYFISILCAVIFAYIFNNSVGNLNRKYNVWLLLIFIIFALWSTAAYYKSGYIHPLMREKIITGAWAHRDALYFSSLAGIFKTYGVSSTGLDGVLVTHYYHSVSNMVIGLMSGFFGISTMTFYDILFPILIIPLFFLTFIWCVIELSAYYYKPIQFYNNNFNIVFWLILFIIFATPLPIIFSLPINNYFIIEKYQYLGSHSYSFALIFTFVGTGILFSSLNQTYPPNGPKKQLQRLLFIIGLPLFFLIIGYTKVSFIYLIGSIYLYLIFRYKSYNKLLHIISLSSFILISCIIYFNLIAPFESGTHTAFNASGGPIIPGNKVWTYYISELVKYPFFIYPSLIFIIIRLYCLEIKSISILYTNFKKRKLIDIELLVLLIIVSFIPPYNYFKGFQIYIAYLMIISNLELFYQKLLIKN